MRDKWSSRNDYLFLATYEYVTGKSWLEVKVVLVQDTLELFQALADELEINYLDLSNLDAARLSASKYAKIFPGLILKPFIG